MLLDYRSCRSVVPGLKKNRSYSAIYLKKKVYLLRTKACTSFGQIKLICNRILLGEILPLNFPCNVRPILPLYLSQLFPRTHYRLLKMKNVKFTMRSSVASFTCKLAAPLHFGACGGVWEIIRVKYREIERKKDR